MRIAGPWDSDTLGSQSFTTPSHGQELAKPHLLFMCLFWLCWVFVAVWAFSSFSDWGLVSSCGTRDLLVVASLVAEHRL